MGIGSFFTNFGIGFLSQANQGFENQRKMQYEQDARRAAMMDRLAVSAIDDYHSAETQARQEKEQYDNLTKLWGPEKAKFVMKYGRNMSMEDIARININQSAPDTDPGSYADDIDQKRWDVYQHSLGVVKAAWGNKPTPNGLDIGQIFPPPVPYGSKIMGQLTPLQQQQIQARKGYNPGNVQATEMNPPQPEQTPGAMPDPNRPPGLENATPENVPLTNRLSLAPKDRAPTGTNTLPAQKYILGNMGALLEPYNVDGKGVQMVENPMTHDIEVHFNSPIYAQVHSTLMSLVQPDFQKAIQYAQAHGINLNSIDWTPILTKGKTYFDLLISAAQRQGITESDKQIAWIAQLSRFGPQNTVAAINKEYAQLQIDKQTQQQQANKTPQATVKDFKDQKLNPNNPGVQMINERYEDVVKYTLDLLNKKYAEDVAAYKRGQGNKEPVEPTEATARALVDGMGVDKFEKALGYIDADPGKGGTGPLDTDALKE